jgi:hypothetical protein
MFKEYILAQEFGWTLDYIRSMSEEDRENLYLLTVTRLMYKNFDIINMMAMTTTGKSLI